MTRHLRLVAVLALFFGSFGLAGCLKATGGGKLTGQIHGGSVTTGFQMRCENVGNVGHITGQLQYHDHGTDTAFHAVIDAFLTQGGLSATCEALDEFAILTGSQGRFDASGTYTPQPKNRGIGGDIFVVIYDQSNTEGFLCDAGNDAIGVVLSGGVYGGYAEQGCLQKGNFTVFTE